MNNKNLLIIIFFVALCGQFSTSHCSEPKTITLIIHKVNIDYPDVVLGTLIFKDIPLTTTIMSIKNLISKNASAQDKQLHWTSDIQLMWFSNNTFNYLSNEKKTIGDYIKEYHMHDPYNPLPLRGITLKLLVPNL
jgi:hypothetical protein